MMQKVMNKNMTSKEAFIYASERAGINAQYYLDTKDNEFLNKTIMYVRAAYILSKELSDNI